MNKLKFTEKTNDYGEKIFSINNHKTLFLGTIEYNSYWRKYVFSTLKGRIFDIDCLQEIMEFIKKIK